MTAARRLIDLTEHDLRELLRDVVREELDARAVAPGQGPLSEFMCRDAVAEMLAVKPTYVGELVRRHDLPAAQRGKGMRLYFLRSEVVAWATSRRARSPRPTNGAATR